MKSIPVAIVLALLASPAVAQVPGTLKYSILPSAPEGVDERFGLSVAVETAYTVAGDQFDDTGAADSGVVRVYDSSTGAQVFLLANPNPAADAYFGGSVAISGTRVVVGAEGAASTYVYDLAGGTPTVPVATLTNASSGFGTSVSISGTRLVVGAPFDNTGASSSGRAYVYDISSGTPTVPVATLNNPGPASGDNFGKSVAISGTRVVVGTPYDDTGASGAGSAYVYDVSSGTPTVPVATLNNPSPAVFDDFGYSVAISETRVVVGADADDTGAGNAGSAYAYDMSSATPTVPVFTLNNPSPASGDFFGYSVAISGTQVLVGVYQGSTEAADTGSAYLYDLSGGTPTLPVAELDNPSPAANDGFGWSVAIAGTRAAVGAPGDDTGATDAGSVYLFDLSSGTPSVPLATLNHSVAGDQFGTSMSISGTKMVVGAPFGDTGAADAGSAYVYDLASGTPTIPLHQLFVGSPVAGDNFGSSVAIAGSMIAVGVPFSDAGAVNSGVVQVYDLTNVTPVYPVVTLSNPAPGANDNFGKSVAMSGTRLVAGIPSDDTGAVDSGSAYVINTNGGAFLTINNPAAATSDGFGTSVAISSTLVVVGAPFDDTGATNAGSAYVYDLNSATPTVPVRTLANPSPTTNDFFGYSVAISGKLVVVGAYRDDQGATDAGSVYVYDLTSATPTVPIRTLNDPDAASSDNFGFSVAISGTRAVVGAYRDNAVATDAGTVYVYELSGATPTVPVATLSNPAPAVDDRLGNSVAIDGTTVAVGAALDDVLATDKGAAYVFASVPDIGVEQPANANLTDGGAAPLFGSVILGTSSAAKTFTIRNAGSENLTGLAITKNGLHSADFNVNTTGMATTLIPGATTTFTVTFTPGATGARSAVLHIASNDPDESSFDLVLAGTGTIPDIAVTQASLLTDAVDSVSFGNVAVGGNSGPLTFTITNTGTGNLTGLALTKDGANAADFTVGALSGTSIVSGPGTVTFSVTFIPGGTVSGVRNAAIHIASNDPNENPFDIPLRGAVLSRNTDIDNDGMNDLAEGQLETLGFDWQVGGAKQQAMVSTYYSSANTAGLFTPAQVQALNVGTPLIQRNPTTGVFTLTIGVEKSTTLQPLSFQPFSMTTAPGAVRTFNGAGKLEFQFTVPDNAAFFQLRAE